jgi:hypothetical protein
LASSMSCSILAVLRHAYEENKIVRAGADECVYVCLVRPRPKLLHLLQEVKTILMRDESKFHLLF